MVGMAILVLLAAAAALAVTAYRARPSDLGLAAAVARSRFRPFEPRLSVSAYAPTPTLDASRARPAVPPPVALATARLELATTDADSASRSAELGAAWLLSGRVTEAVDALEDATRREPRNGQWLSDLSAAYLVRAATDPLRAIDVPRALAAADRAIQAGAGVAARFNRALAIQRLLPGESAAAWRDYLAQDGTSEWAADARARLDAASREMAPGSLELARRLGSLDETLTPEALTGLVEIAPGVAREAAEERLLPAWGRALLAGDAPVAAAALDRVRRIAELVASGTGDRSLVDSVAALDRQSPAVLRTLAQAHVDYGDARVDYDAQRLDEALARFIRVAAVFEAHRSPMALWARMHEGFVHSHQGRMEAAFRLTDAVFAQATGRAMHGIVGRIHRMRGVLAGRAGRFTDGRAEYDRGLAAFERAGEPGMIVSMRSTLAETLDYLGESAAAWQQRLSALAAIADVPAGHRRDLLLQGAALASQRVDAPEAALFFVGLPVDGSVPSENPLTQFESYRRRAEIELTLGRVEACADSLARARSAASRLPDREVATGAFAELDLIEGHLRARTSGDATALLDSASAVFTRRGLRERLPSLYLYRGMALAKTDPAAARQALDRGIEALQAAGPGAPAGAASRVVADLFEARLRLDFEQNDVMADVRTLERERRLLLGRPSESVVVPGGGAATGGDAPTSTLVYRFVSGRLHAWSFDGRTWMRHPLSATQDEIVRLVLRYRQAVESGGDRATLEAAGAALYDVVLAPLKHRFAAAATLAVSPHGPLHGVPFAALFDRSTKRFLVQDVAVAIVPSLSGPTTGARSGRMATVDRRALIVGASQPDPALDAAPLPNVDVEAREVAATQARATLLTGAQATAQRFREALPRHDLVHFSGHVVANLASPAYSRMLFARDPAPGAANVIYAGELARLRLDHLALVVLAACDTARTDLLPNEGLNSLATQFLAAGASVVIAASWPIDDAMSARVFPRLYEQLRRSPSPVDALRQVQVRLLTDTDPVMRSPAVWGALQAFGTSRGPAN